MRLNTLCLILLLSSCASAKPQAPIVVEGPIVDLPRLIEQSGHRPTNILPHDWGGGADTDQTRIQLDVIHNNVRQLKKRLDDKGEQNIHDDVETSPQQ